MFSNRPFAVAILIALGLTLAACGNAPVTGDADARPDRPDALSGDSSIDAIDVSDIVEAGLDAADDSEAADSLDASDVADGAVDDSDGGCAAGLTVCSGACVDTMTDNANCGTCAMACPGTQRCVMGACVTTCPAGQVACGGTCVDTMTDNANCGTCATACPMGSVCTAGVCRVPCPMGQTSCAGMCVDTQSNPMHCGACGNACTAMQRCDLGVCRAGCPTGQTSCAGTCVDTNSDRMNCGACGTICAAGQMCTTGVCRVGCPVGRVLCGATCADTNTDALNCGACGTACSGGQVCTAGRCGCALGQTMCGARCVDLRTDNANCGVCGAACIGGGRSCMAGVCSCPAGQVFCGGVCVNLLTDAANCGGCGRPCAAPRSCTAGACICPTGQTLCGSNCVSLQSDNTNCGTCGTVCAGGRTCQAGACVCPAGQTFCAGACVNLQSDNANCGTCGTPCAGGRTCVSGACLCPSGQTFCGAACLNLQNDNSNCGICARVCPAGQSCMAGACTAMPPPNDTLAGAVVIDVSMPTATLSVNTTGALNHTAGLCACSTGRDVFYRFTLARREIVYADTFGSTFDTTLFLQDAAGVNIVSPGLAPPFGATCNDNAPCAGSMQSIVAAVLPAGTYHIVLSGCGSGGATLHFHHLPMGSGGLTNLATTAGVTQSIMATPVGVSAVTSTCCSSGPEHTFWWVTCPAFASQSFTATTCGGAAFMTELDQQSATRVPISVCNGASVACGSQSLVQSTLPAGAGLSTLYLDSCGATGAANVGVTFGPCTAPSIFCQGRCRNIQTDPANCGACGTVCGGGTICNAGSCACPVGQTLCAGTCRALQTDANNCGACGVVCGAGRSCQAGVCRPVNNDCAGATLIALSPGTTTVAGSTVNATNSGIGCASADADVFYSFTLAQQELVYIDTFGSSFDTVAGIVPSACAMPAITCNDNSCALLQSQTTAVLAAGTHFVQVGGFAGATGAFTLRIQHIPVAGATLGAIPAGAFGPAGIFTASTAGAPNSPGGCFATPDRWYSWVTCPSFVAGTLTASTCSAGTTYDSALQYRSGGGASTCASASVPVCAVNATFARISAPVAAGAGVHTLFVEGDLGASGPYALDGVRP